VNDSLATASSRLLAIILLCLVAAPLSANKDKKKKDPPPPTTVTLSADVPSLAAIEETAQTQVKGDVRITVSQDTYGVEESIRTEVRQIAPPSKFGLVLSPCENGVYVEKTQIPELHVTPDHLMFHVHINNQMSRVFNGKGLVVEFNVANKVVSVDPSGYGDLVHVIISPRGEQDITIVGPEINQIPAPSTVGLSLYDVVTKTDQAGNVVEKQNYEWYFSYKTQATQKQFTVPAPEVGWSCPQQ